jgi:hypothetical protein
MPYVLRSTTDVALSEVARIPQIVIIDKTGPSIVLGTAQTSVLLIGEFLKGPFDPRAVGSNGEIGSLYGGVSPFFSQSAAGVQDGSGVSYNGNGMLQLKSKKFRKLVIGRVDTEAVATDGGTTKSGLTITVSLAVSDPVTNPNRDLTNQSGAANTLARDVVIPAGTRFGDAAVGVATGIVALSQDLVIPKGTLLTGAATPYTVVVSPGAAITVNGAATTIPTTMCQAFFVKTVHPIVITAIGAIDTVIDSTVPSGDAQTTITVVTNAAAMWPPGTGTTLALRIESQYLAAIDRTLPTADPLLDVTVIWSARRTATTTATIQKRLLRNAQDSSESNAQGRVALASPDPSAATDATSANTAKANAKTFASGANLQDDRMILAWPHTQIFSEELGNVNVTISPEGWMASVLSIYAEEFNPGIANDGLMDGIVALEQAFVLNALSKQDYMDLQAGGVSAIQKDPTVSWWFVNGVTAVNPLLKPTRVPIKRRRMADLIQATLAGIAAPYLKQPATTERVDTFLGEMATYLDLLKSERNPSQQRIVDYSIDGTSGNTPELTALGIFTFIVYVRLLPSMDDIILQTQIGETVTIPVQQAA